MKIKWNLAPSSALIVAVLTITMLFSSAVATAYASQGALPGDALYPVKTGLEKTQLVFSWSEAKDAELNILFAQKRLDELTTLIDDGRFEDVSASVSQFEHHVQGAIEALAAIAENDPEHAQVLVLSTVASLSDYSQILTDLYSDVPEMEQPSIEDAITLSQHGMNMTEVEFVGIVESISDDTWRIALEGGPVVEIIVTDLTEVDSNIVEGDTIKVEALLADDGTQIVREIKLDDDIDDNSNEDEDLEDEEDNANTVEDEDDNANVDEDEDDNANVDEDEDENANVDEDEDDDENHNTDEVENDNHGSDDHHNDNDSSDDNGH